MDLDPGTMVNGKRMNRYDSFSSNAQDYRAAAQTIRGYGAHTIAGIMSHYDPKDPAQAKQVQAFMNAHGPHVGLHQRLPLHTPAGMSRFETALAMTEQHHKRDFSQLYAAILKANTEGIKAGMAQAPIHLHIHSKTGPGARIAVSAHGAAK